MNSYRHPKSGLSLKLVAYYWVPHNILLSRNGLVAVLNSLTALGLDPDSYVFPLVSDAGIASIVLILTNQKYSKLLFFFKS